MKKNVSPATIITPVALADLTLAVIDGGAPPSPGIGRSNAVRDSNAPTIHEVSRGQPQYGNTGSLPQGERATFENSSNFYAPKPTYPPSSTSTIWNYGR